jgi:hemoglobin/transferrin/lactoferrin receptor protein
MRGPSAETIELDAITVTATRQPTQVLDVPATVTVISREQIGNHLTRDVQDLVRYQPGVDVGRATSGTDPWHNVGSFTIRGVSANRVHVLVDGSRVIERITDGTRDFVDLPFLRSVEILRGPGSVLWGADALGGIVSYNTLDPDDLLRGKGKNWAVRSEVGYDSFDHSFSKTMIGAIQVGEWQALAGINHRTSREPKLSTARADGGIIGCPRTLRYLPCNVLDPVDTDGINVLGKLVYRPSADHEVKLTGELFDRNSVVNQLYDFNAVSGGIRNGEYLREQELSRWRLQLAHQWQVGAPFLDNVKWNVAYSPQERNLTNRRTQYTATNQPRLTLGTLSYKEEFLQGDLQLSSSFGLLGAQHRLTYGFQGDQTQTDYRRQDTVRNLVTNVTTVTRGGGFNFANATTTRADGYIQDEIGMFGGRFTLTPGVRFANYVIDPRPDSDYVVVPGRAPRKLESSRLIPQVGALFKIDETYSLYGRYAEGFKMPTSQQLFTSLPFGNQNLVPNPDLRAEKAQSYEAGVRGRFGNAWFSLGVFHASYTDFIQELYSVPGTTDITSRNLARVELTGVEASAEWAFTEELVGTASLSYQHGNQRTTPTARRTAFDAASPFKSVLGLKWIKREYGLEAEVLATFAAAVDRASSPTIFKPDGYMLWDAYLNWRPSENIKFRAGVQNIFDERYFPSVRGYDLAAVTPAVAQTNPLELQVGAGRTWKLGATIDF